MKKSFHSYRYSIWIDRRQAMILTISPEGVKTFETIESENTKPERFDGEGTNKISEFGFTISRESTEQEKFNNRHQVYLKKVLSALKGVNALLILGSGETRFELQNALEKNKMFNGIWVENKASKKINQRELEIETENHFNLHLS